MTMDKVRSDRINGERFARTGMKPTRCAIMLMRVRRPEYNAKMFHEHAQMQKHIGCESNDATGMNVWTRMRRSEIVRSCMDHECLTHACGEMRGM